MRATDIDANANPCVEIEQSDNHPTWTQFCSSPLHKNCWAAPSIPDTCTNSARVLIRGADSILQNRYHPTGRNSRLCRVDGVRDFSVPKEKYLSDRNAGNWHLLLVSRM